jgi:hypothetical protein
MDVLIPPGEDFVRLLGNKIEQTDVVLAVIGPRWLALLQNRQPGRPDYVAFEIATALSMGKLVIPVITGTGKLPEPGKLPFQSVSMRPQR